MKKFLTWALLPGLLLSLTGCKTPQTSSFQSQEITCLGVELDGSQTVRVTGTGRNKADAIEQAKKNAVWAVVFQGIRGGMQGCDVRPLVNEANARDKYEEYWNIFFMDNGEYLKYVSSEDKKNRSNDKAKNKYSANYTTTVRVLRSELRARLRADNILKQ